MDRSLLPRLCYSLHFSGGLVGEFSLAFCSEDLLKKSTQLQRGMFLLCYLSSVDF